MSQVVAGRSWNVKIWDRSSGILDVNLRLQKWECALADDEKDLRTCWSNNCIRAPDGNFLFAFEADPFVVVVFHWQVQISINHDGFIGLKKINNYKVFHFFFQTTFFLFGKTIYAAWTQVLIFLLQNNLVKKLFLNSFNSKSISFFCDNIGESITPLVHVEPLSMLDRDTLIDSEALWLFLLASVFLLKLYACVMANSSTDGLGAFFRNSLGIVFCVVCININLMTDWKEHMNACNHQCERMKMSSFSSVSWSLSQ